MPGVFLQSFEWTQYEQFGMDKCTRSSYDCMHHTKRETNRVLFSSGGRVLVSIPVRGRYGGAKRTTVPAVLRHSIDVLPDPRETHVSRATAFPWRLSSGRYSRGDWASSFVTSTDLNADACTEWAGWQHILQGTGALSTKDSGEQHQQEPVVQGTTLLLLCRGLPTRKGLAQRRELSQ